MAAGTDDIITHIDRHLEASVERLKALLRIPSVGTDPAHHEDTRRAARWLKDELAGLGFEARLEETPGQPMVLAHYDPPGGAKGPRLLYYGHYDVQPPDPLDLWESPPFEPVIKEGPEGRRIVARGAVDDKGQLMTFIEAFRAWKEVAGELPVPITVLLEGEEESASVNLEPFIEAKREALKADIAVVSDTGMVGVDQPAITYMLRGIVYIEVTLEGPSHDLHSGMYGGAVVNPINALARLIAGLHDADHRVTLPGFYDDVREIEPAEAEAWRSLGWDDAKFLKTAGLESSVGEAGRSVVERIWARPTVDVNGIWGGYTGEGSKTVIPARASAKVSCRLVPDQDPARVQESLIDHFKRHAPKGCRITVRDFGKGGPIRVATDSPFMKAAERAMVGVFPNDPVLIGCGGSIPVAAAFRHLLGIDTLLMGFGLDDDRVHSPNEKFTLACFERGIKTHARFLAEVAGRAS